MKTIIMKGVILFIICVFANAALKVVGYMTDDNNAIIRLLGYFIALGIIIGVLCITLYYVYNINVLELAL